MTQTDSQMQLQQWFDTALVNLRAQGKPSIAASGVCAYRAPDGCRCAVGWLIPDDAYKPYMEGLGAYCPVIVDAIEGAWGNAFFLMGLQVGLHDDFVNMGNLTSLPYPEWLEKEAQGFARAWELTYTPPEGESA